MRSKVTVVLLFLNVVLFYYIYKFETVKPLDANGKHPYGPEVAAIDSLTRTSRSGTVLKLERRGEVWWLTQPYEWPADRNAVARVLNEMQLLEHQTSFAVADLAKSGQSVADYGLDQPAITLSFTSAGKTYVSKIGDDTKIGSRLYLLSTDGARIHVVDRSFADSVGQPLDALRAESIFTVPVFEVRSLNVTAAPSNLKVRLHRVAADHWAFETPILARANKSAVEVTINSLNALTAKNFLATAGSDLERTGLNAPALRVTLEGNARRETLLIGSAVAGTPATPGSPAAQPREGAGTDPEYYAQIEDKAVVFTVPVPQPLLDVLRSAQEELRDRHVLDFDPPTVTALTLTAPGQPELTLQRLESAGSTAAWQVVVRNSGQAPKTSAADTALVEELLTKIHLLSAATFKSDAPSATDLENWGFNRPERELTLNLNTGGGPRGTDPSTLTLQIGVKPDEPGFAYAHATNAPFVYQIVSDILEEAPVQARHYRERLLRPLSEGAKIQGLALTEIATHTIIYDKKLGETQTSWDQIVADEPEARRKAIGTTLSQLHTLRAKRFIADNFSPDHADTAQGPQPWKYQLDVNLSLAGGNGAAQNSTSTLYLTERLSGNTQLAGTAEFGGVVFEVTQELLDALFTLAYREKNDPGLPAAVPSPAFKEPTPAPDTAPKEPAPKK